MPAITTGAQHEIRQALKDFIPSVTSPDGIYQLFRLLKYPQEKLFDSSYKRDVAEFDFKKDERDKIRAIYTVFSYDKDLPVFLVEATTTSHAFLKYLTKVLADRYLHFLLAVTSDYEKIIFVLPEYERLEAGKHKLRISKLVLDKHEIYHTDLDTLTGIAFRGEVSWRDLWRKWRDAFDVEKVTERFFLDYQEVFFRVRSAVLRQKISIRDAHEFTLQLLNRIMFIYFVSKKRWLNGEPKFLRWLWKRYLVERGAGNATKDSFYRDWLAVVFFEAFNNRFRDNPVLPTEIKKALRDAPYLNGGLFRKSELDELPIKISDELFKASFEFFEKYNFTIKEDLLDAEVAVDPQMIGYVYESLANVAESSYEREEDLRGAWGIFYTPRVEVEFMCRRVLVQYLLNHLTDVPREKTYELVFDEDKEKVEAFFDKKHLWDDLEDLLDNLSVVDPACGSGAFLVGMVNVLSDVYRVIYKHLKRDLTDFQLKNKIIMRSLYGVDVMPWAVHAAELRLWLQLIVESDLRPDDLKAHPLLPNLNMNLRIGDSLVQEIGGINLHVRDPAVSPKLKQRLSELKAEKEKYFNNDPTAKFKTKVDLENEEVRIFADVIREMLEALSEESNKLSKQLAELERGTQKDLRGNIVETPAEKLEPLRARLLSTENEIGNLEAARRSLRDPEKRLFVWEIAFAEIFGQKGGFDIVIGNPPYVKHQRISPPDKPRASVSELERIRYKEKLVESVRAHFPQVGELDKRSDYYVYFYFHGLALLNDGGAFCFITSSSWLDALYGARFQEFLLKYVPIAAIYDNPKRAFAHAQVNTVIPIFKAPTVRRELGLSAFGPKGVRLPRWPALGHVARFIMFQKPFEDVSTSKCLVEAEGTTQISQTAEFRVYPIPQEELLEDGWEYPEGYDSSKAGKFLKGRYAGNFLGAKYLRSPDIFFTILRKGSRVLTKLRDIAGIETYLNTGGADDFFFVERIDEKGGLVRIRNPVFQRDFLVEREFIVDFVESPRELSSIHVTAKGLRKRLFRVPLNLSLQELKQTKAWEYLAFGRENGFHRVSGRRNKTKWWILPTQAYDGAEIIVPCRVGSSHTIYYNPNRIVSHRFYRVRAKDSKMTRNLVVLLNSTLSYLCLELFRNPMTGGGVLDIGKPAIGSIVPLKPDMLRTTGSFESFMMRKCGTIFEECGLDPARPFRDQEPRPLPDRRKVDDIVFDAIGLSDHEQKEVYWSTCELAKARLDKAKSLKKKG